MGFALSNSLTNRGRRSAPSFLEGAITGNVTDTGMTQGTAASVAQGISSVSNMFSNQDAAGHEARHSLNSFTQSSAPEKAMTPEDTRGYVYPPDLTDYFMTFTFMKYQRPQPLERATSQILNTITLPIPNTLAENNSVTWEGKSTGLWGEMFDVANAPAGSDGTAGTAARAGTRVVAATVGSARIGSRSLAAILPGDIEAQIGQQMGAIFNPHLTMFFEGPTFQEFSFSWRFHPFNASESELIKKICWLFKQHMLATRAVSASQSFLAYPAIVQMALKPNTFPFKKAVIQSCNFNYSPMGYPSYFAGTKAPRFIELSITVKAIEYWLGAESVNGDRRTEAELRTEFEGAVDRGISAVGDVAGQTLTSVGGMIFGGAAPAPTTTPPGGG